MRTPSSEDNRGLDQKIEDEAKALAADPEAAEAEEGPKSLERKAMEHSATTAAHGDRLTALEAKIAALEAKLRHWL